MKKGILNKIVLSSFLLLSTISLSLLTSCNDTNSEGKTTITFFGWGNETEVALTEQFVNEYNESQDEIYVKYTSIPSEDYATKIGNALRSKNPPDVLIAGDGEIKPWIELGGLASLDEYLDNSQVFDLSDFWEEGQNRYLYNVETRMNGSGHYYGVMRDLSPTVLFYNKTAFEKVGITCISLSEEECLKQYGCAAGYFEHEGKKYFNNKIAMNWEEMLELSKINTFNTNSEYRNPSASTTYGIYYVNWFSLGWSVGANSLQFVEDSSEKLGGHYEFSLNDTRPNYSVKEGQTVTIGSKTYNEGELIDYGHLDLLTMEDKSKCNELPSALEAMQFYVDLSTKYNVAPKPNFMNSTSSYSVFASGNQTAMIVDSRYAVGIYRSLIKEPGKGNGFEWDCAPLPVHENGIKAGHSGSLAYCISAKSKNKDAAFKFIEYINGEEGQIAFAQAGFTIPNTKTLSNSEYFLQSAKAPYNSEVFIEAAAYQTVGDWGFLPSKDWITPWANRLNGDVLNGNTPLKNALDASAAETQKVIDNYYSKI